MSVGNPFQSVQLERPVIDGTDILGYDVDAAFDERRVALREVHQIEARQFDGARTAQVVVASAVVTSVVVGIVWLATADWSWGSSSGGYRGGDWGCWIMCYP